MHNQHEPKDSIGRLITGWQVKENIESLHWQRAKLIQRVTAMTCRDTSKKILVSGGNKMKHTARLSRSRYQSGEPCSERGPERKECPCSMEFVTVFNSSTQGKY